jgi:hypothetical protein
LEGADPATMASHFPQPDGNSDCSLHDLQSESLPDSIAECPLCFLDVAALRPQFLMPLLHCHCT